MNINIILGKAKVKEKKKFFSSVFTKYSTTH